LAFLSSSRQSFHDLLSFLCFFFSSRRRHTRSKRDWSSDVCSSDLKILFPQVKSESYLPFLRELHPHFHHISHRVHLILFPFQKRSEERRVGKTCRHRGWRRYLNIRKYDKRLVGRCK